MNHQAILQRLSLVEWGGGRRRSEQCGPSFVAGVEVLEGRQCLAAVPVSLWKWAVADDHVALVQARARPAAAVPAVPAGTITGVVKRAAGAPLRSVTVNLYDPGGNLLSSTVTGPGGRYVFRGLAPGNYLVQQTPPRGFTQGNPTFPDYPPTAQATPAGGFGDDPGTWNYTGAGGAASPADWVTSGSPAPFESGINITGPVINLARHLAVHYRSTSQYTQTLASSSPGSPGFQLQARGFAAENRIRVNGVDFELRNIHFHEATENIVNGRPPGVMEVHFVHESAAGGEAVLAVFIKLGRGNPTLGRFFGSLGNLSTTGGSTQSGTAVGPINFRDLLPRSFSGWFYPGSLTTPPLSTPVNFFVLATPIEMSLTQFQQYQSFATAAGFFPNNRPVQPLSGRVMNSLTAITLGETAGRRADIVNVRLPHPRTAAGSRG